MKNRNSNLNNSIQLLNHRNSSANYRNMNNNLDLRYQYTQNGNYPKINKTINTDKENDSFYNGGNYNKNSLIESRKKFKIKHRVPSAGNRNNSSSIISLPKINSSYSNNYNNEISIYFFGEADYCMRYLINESKWEIIYY